METLTKEQIIKQAKIIEDYQGNESDIVGAEKSGKYHGFIAGAEWATTQLKADKEELLEALDGIKPALSYFPLKLDEIESLIKKHKQ